MSCGLKCSKGLKICCGVTSVVMIVLLVILVVLFLTVFKKKDPTITLQSVTIERIHIGLPTVSLNASLGIVVTVYNPNHGSFRYQNSTAYLNYRGHLLAQAPLHEDTLPSRKAHNISTSLNIFADVIQIPELAIDLITTGLMNFTSTATLVGKVKIMNLFKIKATSYSTCQISVFVRENIVNSTCNSEIKF